jgi:hypothetical protein
MEKNEKKKKARILLPPLTSLLPISGTELWFEQRSSRYAGSQSHALKLSPSGQFLNTRIRLCDTAYNHSQVAKTDSVLVQFLGYGLVDLSALDGCNRGVNEEMEKEKDAKLAQECEKFGTSILLVPETFGFGL